MTQDQRPDPKPRKHALLWQNYLWWNELIEMRKRHNLRISSVEAGKSNLDANFERDMIGGMGLDDWIDQVNKAMIACGHTAGPVWDWLTRIKGLASGSLAAQLIAHIDDIGKFDTISKLWRYAGWAVIDGQIDRNTYGEKSKFNGQLKSTCWKIVDQFIKHNTLYYRDLYDEYKARQREEHPEPIKVNGKWMFNDGHLHNRAIRYVAKRFLAHLWLVWREADGLSVSGPWISEYGGHTHIEPPPNWPLGEQG